MTVLSRPHVIQTLLDLFDDPEYLEIGVLYGETFKLLKAKKKVAVDVCLNFDHAEHIKEQPQSELREMPSDKYFSDFVNKETKFDVAFIDGLHTFEQTLRDLLNIIPHLKEGGVIIIDDVKPFSYAASLPDMNLTVAVNQLTGTPDAGWMGDVYKLVYFINTFLQSFTYYTVQENHGQTILWLDQRKDSDIVHRRVEDIGRLPFETIAVDSDPYKFLPFNEIVERFKQSKTMAQ